MNWGPDTGSEQYQRAVHWAVDQFRAMGIAEVRLEAVVLKHGWQRGPAQARLLGEVPRVLHVYAQTVNQVLRTSAPTEGGEALALPVGSIGRAMKDLLP
jgi:hypothetical protein